MKIEAERLIVFTDLDGTLLNHDDYSCKAALPTIDRLKSLHIPLIFVTSKTIREVKILRKTIGMDCPYICENGSLIVVPEKYHYLVQGMFAQTQDEGNETICFRGTARKDILIVLDVLRSQYRFRGFAEMPDAEIADRTGLSTDQAAQANCRLASEPIVWQGDGASLDDFTKKLISRKLRIVKGGRFYHIMGDTDKVEGVVEIIRAYENYNKVEVHSIILGDSENDLAMLHFATTAVIVPKADGTAMQLSDNKSVIYAPQAGASGWCESIEELLNKLI